VIWARSDGRNSDFGLARFPRPVVGSFGIAGNCQARIGWSRGFVLQAERSVKSCPITKSLGSMLCRTYLCAKRLVPRLVSFSICGGQFVIHFGIVSALDALDIFRARPRLYGRIWRCLDGGHSADDDILRRGVVRAIR